LRLNSNLIETIPAYFVGLAKLEILDLGNNRIAQIEAIEPILELSQLRSLNLQKNLFEIDYAPIISERLPAMVVLDSKRIKPKKSHFTPDHPKFPVKREAVQKAKAEIKRRARAERLRELKQSVEATGRVFHRNTPKYKAMEKRQQQKPTPD
jgi:hypothetical protein